MPKVASQKKKKKKKKKKKRHRSTRKIKKKIRNSTKVGIIFHYKCYFFGPIASLLIIPLPCAKKKDIQGNRGDLQKIHLTQQFIEASGCQGDFFRKKKSSCR